MKLKPYFDLLLEKQIWRDSYILNNLRAFQSQEISCWLEELDGNVKHADPGRFPSALWLSSIFMLSLLSITTTEDLLGPEGIKLLLFPQKFSSNTSGILSNC